MKSYKAFLFIACALFSLVVGSEASLMAEASQQATYQNYLTLENEWAHGSPDPQILRFNGRYYLYPSTDVAYGVKAWSSEDLVNWKYEGIVADEDITYMAWGPRVVYWDGMFYMYFSPAGKGHYVLTSKEPTGPFKLQTDNLGFNLDGSVFIDDDGQWYFTHASGRGIVGHRMLDPFTVESIGKTLNAYLNYWTEGGKIFKRDGVYYLTYTGNHWLSKGYRIGYSVSTDGPLGEYRVPDNNPIVISTEEGFNGLGNGFPVLGPDLDSYYLFYHNLIGKPSDNPRVRKLNVDRLVFNGQKMSVLGPTRFPQPLPARPDFFTWVDEDRFEDYWVATRVQGSEAILTRLPTEDYFTAEFNLQLPMKKAGVERTVGVIFCYEDADNYCWLAIDPDRNTLTANRMVRGEQKTLAMTALPKSIDLANLHSIRAVKSREGVEVFFDNMRKLHFRADARGGKIGYLYRNVEPVFRHTAFSNQVKGSSDFAAYKPIPGSIEGIHYRDKDGCFSRRKSQANPIRVEDSIKIVDCPDHTYAVHFAEPGDWVAYNINVSAADWYGMDLTIQGECSGAKFAVYVDDERAATFSLSGSRTAEGQKTKVRAGFLRLPEGFHTLKIKLIAGDFTLRCLDFYQVNTEAVHIRNSLTKGVLTGGWEYFGEWNWLSNEDGYVSMGMGDQIATVGGADWTDYCVSVDIAFAERELARDAGVLVRATNVSYYPEQVRDSLMGYYVAVNCRQITLKKLNYDFEVLDLARVELEPGRSYRMKVMASGSRIRVYWEDMDQPVIDYEDPQAFMHGAVGLRADNIVAFFKNLVVDVNDLEISKEVK